VKLLAAETGITQYYAEHKPEDKVARIDELKKQGTVMMVGDGINDAPALAAADIGVSLAAQSGITTDAATVVLLRNKIESLSDAISISRLTYTTIKQNLFWAFFYNVLAIPLAAAGYLSPMIGAAAMACSDLIVIGNSLLLRYKRLR
jgi:Cu+-exporting ATPase